MVEILPGDEGRTNLRPLSPHRIRREVLRPRRIPVVRPCQALPVKVESVPLPNRLLSNDWSQERCESTPCSNLRVDQETRTAVVIRRVFVPSKPRIDEAKKETQQDPLGQPEAPEPENEVKEDEASTTRNHEIPEEPTITQPPDEDKETASTRPSSDDDDADIAQSGTTGIPEAKARSTLKGEPIAFDEQGRPIILRSVDAESGQTRHLVCNEDGTWHTFGERTVDSLMKSGQDDARSWLEALSHRDLRGLVHELGQRLLRNSQLYQKQQGILEGLSDKASYSFFGLTPQCSERELDNAYRRLAKRMHPDKNGGTELAKKRFQHMKERYEALKARRGGPTPPDEGQEEEEPEKQKSADTGRIEFDPFDRKSLDQTVWKMLAQLRMLKQGLQEISQQIGQREAPS